MGTYFSYDGQALWGMAASTSYSSVGLGMNRRLGQWHSSHPVLQTSTGRVACGQFLILDQGRVGHLAEDGVKSSVTLL